MITKLELVDKILNAASGGDATEALRSRYHPADIESYVAEAYDFLLVNAYRQAQSKDQGAADRLLDNYTKTFVNVPVEFDQSRQEYYSDMPVPPMAMGIRFISFMHDQSSQFDPIGNNASVVFSSLEVGKINTRPSFYVERKSVYYDLKGLGPKAVLMKIIPSFDDLEDDDYIEEPQLVQRTGVLTIHDFVMQRLAGMPPEKMINDGSSR